MVIAKDRDRKVNSENKNDYGFQAARDGQGRNSPDHP
jgi:hypothetical protein